MGSKPKCCLHCGHPVPHHARSCAFLVPDFNPDDPVEAATERLLDAFAYIDIDSTYERDEWREVARAALGLEMERRRP